MSLTGLTGLQVSPTPGSRRPAADAPAARQSLIGDYLARQAATVGRRPLPAALPAWVPRLAGAEGACLGVLKGKGNIAAGSVAIYPDGRTLVTGDPYGTIHRWDLEAGRLASQFDEQHAAQIQDIAVSPNGRLLASASSDYTIRIWSTTTEQRLLCCQGHSKEVLKVSWSPDSTRLASASADGSVRIWDALSGACLQRCDGHQDRVYAVQWSPDGRWLASGSGDRTMRIWDAGNGGYLRCLASRDAVESVSWSPDSRYLASGGEDAVIRIWETRTWNPVRHWEAYRNVRYLSCLAWSPDGRLLACGAQGDKTLSIWDTRSGEALARHEFPEGYAWRLAWSPDGAFLASKHAGAICRLWDTRALLAPAEGAFAERQRPSRELAGLPAALAQLHRLNLHPPLSLVRDLLRLTGGKAVAEQTLTPLAGHPGLRALSGLGWPAAARVGLVALLLRDAPLDAWTPPPGLTPADLSAALSEALAGEALDSQPPQPPASALRQSAERIDDRLLGLLTLLGPEAVAADPGLPLYLLSRLPELPPLAASQRRLLGLRLRLDAGGRVQGSGTGVDHTGITSSGNLRALLPSQLALPAPILESRFHRQELLYRARSGQEPPRLRPTVLVLDISASCCGSAATTTRLAATLLANALREARLPALLVAAGGANTVRTLERPADLVDLWTLHSLEPAQAAAALRTARALRETLRDSALEPVVVLLSHPWFGAEEDIAPWPGLRGLFVQYPHRAVRPVLADHCERWTSLSGGDIARLAECLGRLAG